MVETQILKLRKCKRWRRKSNGHFNVLVPYKTLLCVIRGPRAELQMKKKEI